MEYRPPDYSAGDDGAVSFSREKKLPLPLTNGVGVGEGGPSCSSTHPHLGPGVGGGVIVGPPPALDSPTNDGPASISSAEEHTPMLQPPPFDGARAMSPQPGAALNLPPRPISQPPSYEEVLREDGKLPPR